MVTAKVNQQELLTLDKIIREKGIRPNQVSDIYKLRRGRYNDVRIWSEMDLGTCRITDLFITDVDFKPIIDFYPITISYDDCDDDIQSVLSFLNKNEESVENIDEKINIPELEQIEKDNVNNWIF